MLPAEEWWGILGSYGGAIWPVQIMFLLVGLVLLVVLFRSQSPLSNLFIKLYLAACFGWISLVFFWTLGKGLPGSRFFAALFMVVGVLFAADVLRQRMLFRLPGPGWHRWITLFLALCILCYPLIGLALGRPWERIILPGAFPCPTTALALLLLTTSLPRVDRVLYILLLFWAIPFAPFIQIPRYGVWEDTIMLVVGIYSLVMLMGRWRGSIARAGRDHGAAGRQAKRKARAGVGPRQLPD